MSFKVALKKVYLFENWVRNFTDERGSLPILVEFHIRENSIFYFTVY